MDTLGFKNLLVLSLIVISVLTLFLLLFVIRLRLRKKKSARRKSFISLGDQRRESFISVGDQSSFKAQALKREEREEIVTKDTTLKEVKSESKSLFNLDMIINNLDIGIAFTTESDIIFKANKYFERIFYPVEVFGLNINELLKIKTSQISHDQRKESIEKADKFFYLKIDDQDKYFILKKIPIKQNAINMIVLYDKSDVISLEREIDYYKNLKILKVIAGSLAHDLNNQLGIILTHTERLQHQINKMTPKEVSKITEKIRRTCLRARTLTQELLIFGKQLNPMKETIPIKEFLTELAESTFTGTEISVNYSYDPRIRTIEADRNLLEIAVHNIFLNAKQAMADKGSIFISTDYLTPYVEIKIRDTGPGIPNEVKEKLFTPFVTTKPKGTGLGLYSIKKIIEAHQGRVAIESAPGEGTTVKLYLPCEKIDEEVTKSPQPSPSLFMEGKKFKILFMDDDKDIREAIKEFLESLAHEVVDCENGEEAIKIYQEKGPFDIFIFDLSVPGKFDGLQTLREIRKIDPSVKAILTTGHSSLDEYKDLKELKIHGILIKPFTLETLLNTMNTISQENTH